MYRHGFYKYSRVLGLRVVGLEDFGGIVLLKAFLISLSFAAAEVTNRGSGFRGSLSVMGQGSGRTLNLNPLNCKDPKAQARNPRAPQCRKNAYLAKKGIQLVH